MSVPNKGSLGEHSFIEILKEASESLLTGMIRLENGPVIKVAYFQKGVISFASSNEKSDRLTEVLKRSGKLTLEQVEDAQARVKQNVSIGKTLVELGYLSAKDLLWGARAQVNGILHQLLFWADGKYQILIGALPREIIHLNLPVPLVIFEGIMNTQNREWILQHIGSPDAIYALVDDFQKQNEILKLPVTEVVSHLNGRRSLHDIAEKSEIDSFEICKTVVALERLNLARAIQDVPLQMDLSAPETELHSEAPPILEDQPPALLEEPMELGQVLVLPTVSQLETASPKVETAVQEPIEQPEPIREDQVEQAEEKEIKEDPQKESAALPEMPLQERVVPMQSMIKPDWAERRESAGTKSGWKAGATIILVLAAATLGFFYYLQNKKSEPEITPLKPTPKQSADQQAASPPAGTLTGSGEKTGTTRSSRPPIGPIDLLKMGKVAEAASAWSTQMSEIKNIYSIQLVIACQEKTVTDTYRLMNESEGVMVLPLNYKGQNCYRVLFGKFSTKNAATSAIKILPEEFLKQASPASVVELAKVR
jgi:septal ring-binding cell division protein DamX